MEPELHCHSVGKNLCFNNALMVAPPNHPFLENVISHLQSTIIPYTDSKFRDVLSSTGPWMLTSLYENLENKSDIHLFPAELVSPWSKNDVLAYLSGKADEKDLEKKLENAIAIHYFWGSWLNNEIYIEPK